MDLNVNAFSLYAKDWALLTAGNKDAYNTMTIGWGGIGTMWGKPAVTVYVRTSRHTLGFVDKNETFTLSWFDDSYKKDLGILGKESGRDGDKVAKTSLTPKFLEDGVTFEQANKTLVCKKMYRHEMDLDAMSEDLREKWYSTDTVHVMYIAEVVDIL